MDRPQADLDLALALLCHVGDEWRTRPILWKDVGRCGKPGVVGVAPMLSAGNGVRQVASDELGPRHINSFEDRD